MLFVSRVNQTVENIFHVSNKHRKPHHYPQNVFHRKYFLKKCFLLRGALIFWTTGWLTAFGFKMIGISWHFGPSAASPVERCRAPHPTVHLGTNGLDWIRAHANLNYRLLGKDPSRPLPRWMADWGARHRCQVPCLAATPTALLGLLYLCFKIVKLDYHLLYFNLYSYTLSTSLLDIDTPDWIKNVCFFSV